MMMISQDKQKISTQTEISSSCPKETPHPGKRQDQSYSEDERENVFQYSSFCSSFVITITDIGFNWPTKHQQQQENTNIGQIAKMNQQDSSSIKPQTNVTFRFYYRLTITRSRFQGSSINTPQTYQQKPKRICLDPVVIGPQRIANKQKKNHVRVWVKKESNENLQLTLMS